MSQMDDNRQDAQEGSADAFQPFRAVLHPNRSLSPRGFLILMTFLSAISFVTGVAFLLIGAWPVLGFLGLDVLIVYIAFKLNYRAARAYETVEVTRDALVVQRVAANGRRTAQVTFNPYWVRVLLNEEPDGRLAVQLTSHGRTLRIANALSDDERRDFADALKASLQRLKSAV